MITPDAVGAAKLSAAEVEKRSAVLSATMLDVSAAWREDVAHLRSGLSQGGGEAQWLVWLRVGQCVERLRVLPAARRAAYARESAAMWRSLAGETGEERYGRVAEAMERWEGAAPALADFRELLWAAEQAEAAGAVRTAYNMLTALALLVPDGDVRAAYVRAQAGRLLRTLGLLAQAQVACELALEGARRVNDQWLGARVWLGLGVIQHSKGDFPNARACFNSALTKAADFPDVLAAAHLGLVTVAQFHDRYDEAISHAWTALRLAGQDIHAEVEALTILIGLSLDVNQFDAARRTCDIALAKSPRLPMLQSLVRSKVQALLGLSKVTEASVYMPDLITIAENTDSPWEQTHALRVVGDYYLCIGEVEIAREYVARSLQIGDTHAYGELLWLADGLMQKIEQRAVIKDDSDEALRFERRCKSLESSAFTLLEQLSVFVLT
jgi:tetratricopeptide (TPR) repeat protein